MKILNFIFSFKFCLKPKQSEILVYDATSLKFAKLLFFKKTFLSTIIDMMGFIF